ncbi:aspartate racemase [Kaistella treverensis]|uniref:Aspartate racemase n=1 Tax=Kaistella treverensis TaxID=631455 RepID=A0A1I3LYL1_9FLAO|nr:aspartate/glutamate racemase family protein [Kaistella treverensis]SFI89802.1 aspartate racemase [Kaistella treverensis]
MSSAGNIKAILGLGRVSTVYYFNEIQQRYQIQQNEFSTCPLLLYQTDFQEVNPFLPGEFEILIPKVNSYLDRIAELEISSLLVPNITLHETLDQIDLPFEIYHPVDLALKYFEENSIPQAFVFGTLYTMNGDYLKDKFAAQNIKLLQPETADQHWLDDFRKSVYNETQTADEVKYFQNLIEKYAQKSPVLLACTELSAFSPKDNLRCIDMAELQIEAFLK